MILKINLDNSVILCFSGLPSNLTEYLPHHKGVEFELLLGLLLVIAERKQFRPQDIQEHQHSFMCCITKYCWTTDKGFCLVSFSSYIPVRPLSQYKRMKGDIHKQEYYTLTFLQVFFLSKPTSPIKNSSWKGKTLHTCSVFPKTYIHFTDISSLKFACIFNIFMK